jgi:hypothetical protein
VAGAEAGMLRERRGEVVAGAKDRYKAGTSDVL